MNLDWCLISNIANPHVNLRLYFYGEFPSYLFLNMFLVSAFVVTDAVASYMHIVV